MEDLYIGSAIGCLLPVVELAMKLAGEYMKKTNRSILTSKDVEYAMKYCTMYKVGEQSGSELWNEIDTDDEIEEPCDESEEPFTRYVGDDVLMNKINNSYDTWDQWEPTNKIECMLKDAIDKNMY